MLPPLTIRTDKQLSSLKINEDDIKSIIKSLKGKLSIKMLKMCNKTFVYPLNFIFKASIQEGPFLDCCTYSKKESKNLPKTIDQLAFFFFLQNI